MCLRVEEWEGQTLQGRWDNPSIQEGEDSLYEAEGAF